MEKTLTGKTELIQKIKAALDNIRPYLEVDGGDIRIVKIDENFVLYVELLGACSDCSMSMMTLKSGVGANCFCCCS